MAKAQTRVRVESEVFRRMAELGISSEDSLEPFYPAVRDRDDVSVLRCKKSGILILNSTAHVTEVGTYESNESFKYWGEKLETRKHSTLKCLEDDRRRASLVSPLIVGKNWLDIGTGAGGILDQAADKAAIAVAVEPQLAAREAMKSDGYQVYPYISDVPLGESEPLFDVVTSFHVIEHLLDPVGTLRDAYDRMKVGGTVIIEVPHAKDFLIDFLNFDPFKKFTLWSEHLVLHTRESLAKVLEGAGFTGVVINSVQRYPLANHLHWLRCSKPGGHQKWSHLCNEKLDSEYANMLSRMNATDTLIAFGTKAQH